MHERISRLTGMFTANKPPPPPPPNRQQQQQQPQQQPQPQPQPQLKRQQQRNSFKSSGGKRNGIIGSNRGTTTTTTMPSSTTSSLTSSSISPSSTSSNNAQEQKQQQPVESQSTGNKDKSSSNTTSKPVAAAVEAGADSVTVVRMRNKPPLSQTQQQVAANGTAPEPNGNGINNSRSVLQRGLEVLNEVSPEDDGSEEIRKLDSQLDHLNHYMDKVEERIKAHNEKLMDTLRQQKEEREKRRRSFHERIAINQQEDDDFQRQISMLLNRVDISKNRASMYDIISQMEIPKANGQ